MRPLDRVIAALAILVCLSACGGGGGGVAMPTLSSTAFTTNENVALPGQLSASGGSGMLSFSVLSKPASGTLTSFTSAGTFTYMPVANFVGSDSFTVQVSDSQGNMGTGTVAITVHANHAPTADNIVMRADGTALAKIDVLTSAHDPDGDPLTVSLADSALVGQATVNSDQSVSITGLPPGFKGLTRFRFTVTDPSGATASANAAIFVGADPFRALFAGDASGDGTPEVYLTDFASDPQAVTTATQGDYRLAGFVGSPNGATVVYRSESAAGSTLTFVQTAAVNKQVNIALPAGAALIQDAQGKDQFQVSPNGQWIAFVAGQSGASSVYLVNVASPTVLSRVAPAGAVFMSQLSFAADSNSLYFLATSVASGANESLYLVGLSDPTATALISAASAPGSTDTVVQYSISRDQTRILEEADRQGVTGLFYIDPQQLQDEILINPVLLSGQFIPQSSFNSPPGIAVSPDGDQVAYSVQSLLGINMYASSVAPTPDPKLVATGARAIAFRPDGAALLYTTGAQVDESPVASGATGQLVGNGGAAWYDSTGNIVLLEQFLASGGTPSSYPALASTVRGSFGTSQPLGTPLLAAQYFNVSGFDRAVVLLGEGPTTGPPAASVHLSLVNALAPSKLFYLADYQTPLSLTSDVAEIVSE
ncbi:MAG TPA: Ig-like domain-containing protein [Steroidobacteraceae bacterium]|nr:Ig-like domain-containing protein [Steroidobacteraceae bacterium]